MMLKLDSKFEIVGKNLDDLFEAINALEKKCIDHSLELSEFVIQGSIQLIERKKEEVKLTPEKVLESIREREQPILKTVEPEPTPKIVLPDDPQPNIPPRNQVRFITNDFVVNGKDSSGNNCFIYRAEIAFHNNYEKDVFWVVGVGNQRVEGLVPWDMWGPAASQNKSKKAALNITCDSMGGIDLLKLKKSKWGRYLSPVMGARVVNGVLVRPKADARAA